MAFPVPPPILSRRDLRPEQLAGDPVGALRQVYAWMQVARTADNRILELFRQGLIRGTVTGGQGNEGLIVPLALLADKAVDVISFTHRGFGGHLIWSGHLCDHLNQYFANAGSPTKAREGNIHHGDPAARSLPMISHLGAMLGPVLGMTDSQRRLGRPAVGFAFFGDGGSSTGDVHEAMNLAALLPAPILFVIENNKYAYSTPVSEQYAPNVELWKRAAGYGMEGTAIDATDAAATVEALARKIADVRRSGRPQLVEAHTLRLRGHAAYDTGDYLLPGESDRFFQQDPLPRTRLQLATHVPAAELDALDAELQEFVEACVQACLRVPRPSPAGLASDVYAPSPARLPWKPGTGAPALLSGAQALNAALRKILAERPESLVLGQDIATYGGAFKVTEGLLRDFGRPRVFNTPLAESTCTGYAIGLAMNGHRPIEEFQFADFATEAATQITLNAATMYFRSGGACPLILRLPCGGGLTLGSFHSQELESWLLSMPGLKGLYPSTAQDLFNALLAAYEDGNPVLIFEHKALYRQGRQPVAWDPDYARVWQPVCRRAGADATLVAYGEMVALAREAADFIAAEYEREIEVWDLRALNPLQLGEIHASVQRTGSFIVLHEGRRTHGFGAELVAQLAEANFRTLRRPPLRLGSLDAPVPFAPELEHAFRPTRESVIDAIAAWLG